MASGREVSVMTQTVEAGQVFEKFWSLEAQFEWYDLVILAESDSAFRQQFAGHLESGRPSRTDPHLDSPAT